MDDVLFDAPHTSPRRELGAQGPASVNAGKHDQPGTLRHPPAPNRKNGRTWVLSVGLKSSFSCKGGPCGGECGIGDASDSSARRKMLSVFSRAARFFFGERLGRARLSSNRSSSPRFICLFRDSATRTLWRPRRRRGPLCSLSPEGMASTSAAMLAESEPLLCQHNGWAVEERRISGSSYNASVVSVLRHGRVRHRVHPAATIDPETRVHYDGISANKDLLRWSAYIGQGPL